MVLSQIDNNTNDGIWIWRSGSGRQRPQICVFRKTINKETKASSALTKAGKSGSQGFEIDAFSKTYDQIMIASRALAIFCKSGSGSQGAKTDS